MAYLYGFTVNALRNIRALEVDLTPDEGREFKHLIITGPNGSGKTSLVTQLGSMYGVAKRLYSGGLELRFGPGGSNIDAAFFTATRQASLVNVTSPNTPQPSRALDSSHLIQYLVNRKTEQAFAAAEGDAATVERIEKWFETILERFRLLFEEPELSWSFDRRTYRFALQHSSGYGHDLTELADGHAAALAVFAELLLREEAKRAQGKPLDTIVIIDEVEAHLHVSLQEQILPLLTSFFPRTQFIVATHSPAVICSIDNALVVDLGHPERRQRSEDLQGIPYGALMTSHFGLANDFDLHSAGELDALRALANRPDLSAEETAKRDALAGALTRRSPYMALRVWEVLQGVEPTP
jgi:predicted ATPase